MPSLVRVLIVPVFGAPFLRPIPASPEGLRELFGGAPVRAMPVGSSERLALYVPDTPEAPINFRASRVFGGDVRGDAALAALRPLGTLDDLDDHEARLWMGKASVATAPDPDATIPGMPAAST